MALAKSDDHRHENVAAYYVSRRYANRPCSPAVLAGHHSLQRQRRASHGFTLLKNRLTYRGREETIRSSAQQLGSEVLLQGCNSPSHRDVIHAELLGCGRKSPFACCGQKKTNVIPTPAGSHCSFLHTKCEDKSYVRPWPASVPFD